MPGPFPIIKIEVRGSGVVANLEQLVILSPLFNTVLFPTPLIVISFSIIIGASIVYSPSLIKIEGEYV